MLPFNDVPSYWGVCWEGLADTSFCCGREDVNERGLSVMLIPPVLIAWDVAFANSLNDVPCGIAPVLMALLNSFVICWVWTPARAVGILSTG